ncbi:ATP-binding cassette domain-containing protein [Nonomuraea sp. NPDC046802]|uniref:ATP-binding cassette domain-containing protein n=1 Tax=Nonomuraea sp. NPDC046802 TaxID=3154919 RepID=UPI0033F25E42
MIALRDVSIDFVSASFTAIMGPSGSGKTTMLQCAAGPAQPTSGSVSIADTGITGMGELCRALITRLDVIFADEPTGALDSSTGQEILSLLRASVDELGQTVIMVTHEPTAAAHADRVLFLRDGVVVSTLCHPTVATITDYLAR